MTGNVVDTVVFLLRPDAFLLGMKRRGLGAKRWNGYGGKVERGETVREALIRELFEESGVRAKEEDLRKVGVIHFHGPDGTVFETHIFLLYEWEGEPIETEEMSPSWVGYHEVPYDQMWAADRTWLPMALRRDSFMGMVRYDANDQLISADYCSASLAELNAMEEVQ